MARTVKTPGQTTEEQTPVENTPIPETAELSETLADTPVAEVSKEQLDRIEESLASLHAKLDSITEQSGFKVTEAKRWVHDPKLGHVYK